MLVLCLCHEAIISIISCPFFMSTFPVPDLENQCRLYELCIFVELMVDTGPAALTNLWINDVWALRRTGNSTFISQNHRPKRGPSTRTTESRLQMLIFLCYISLFSQRYLVFHRKSSTYSHLRDVCCWEGQHGCSIAVVLGHMVVKTTPWSPPWVPWVRKVSWGEEIKVEGVIVSPSRMKLFIQNLLFDENLL